MKAARIALFLLPALALAGALRAGQPKLFKLIRDNRQTAVLVANLNMSPAEIQKTFGVTRNNVIVILNINVKEGGAIPAAAIPGAAEAALAPAAPPVATGGISPAGPNTAYGNEFNIESAKWTTIRSDAALSGSLASIPTNVKQLYSSLPVTTKFGLSQKIHGTTPTPFSTIDNKQAFISGTAMGQNVFDYMEKELKPSDPDYRQNVAILRAVEPLTPDQRAALVRLLEIDLAR